MSVAATHSFFPKGQGKVGKDFFKKTPRLVALDFDGTLSEIAPTPDSAWMDEDLRGLLGSLSRLPGTQVAILSGRSVSDLKKKIRARGMIYMGNHGLDFSPPGLGWGLKALKNWTRQARLAKERLAPFVAQWPGAFLEIKGPDLSLHYRQVKPKQVQELVQGAIQAVEGLPILARHGKCVLEFRSEGAPGKAEALGRLAGGFFKDGASGICLHVGDDQTDEEVFRALRRMRRRTLGLKVGSGKTKAHFRLKNVRQVHRFLRLFLENPGLVKP